MVSIDLAVSSTIYLGSTLSLPSQASMVKEIIILLIPRSCNLKPVFLT